MAKLIIMQGLPGSGKTTRAREILKENGNVVRVGRDELRLMLHFGKWSGKHEDITRDVQLAMVKHLLQKNNTVLIDDTNIQQSRIDLWKGVAKELDCSIQWEKIDTPLDECIKRDALREKPVGDSVIIAMAMAAGLYPKPQGIVICDLDGTLCNISHRLHFVRGLPEGQKKDWKSFFAAIPDDTMNIPVLDILFDYEEAGNEIFFVSGRGEEHRASTEAWLEKHMKGYRIHKALFMRRVGDRRDDTEVKKDIYDSCFRDMPVVEVIDDRPSVIRMWREQGLKVLDVGFGVEF